MPFLAIDRFKEIKNLAKYPIVLIIMTDGAFPDRLLDKVDDVRLYKILIGEYDRLDAEKSKWLRVKNGNEIPNVLKSILTDIEKTIRWQLGR